MKRRGSTLVELVIGFSAGMSILLLGVQLVHQVISISHRSTALSRHSLAVHRLAHQFRLDLHTAKSANLESESSMALEMFDGSQVSYQFVSSQVDREHVSRDGAKSMENYLLEKAAKVTFAVQGNGDSGEMILWHDNGMINEPLRRDLQVVARRGGWQFNQTEIGRKEPNE